MSRIVRLFPVGRMDYRRCEILQRMVSEEIKRGQCGDTLIVVEHDPVYTVGIRNKQYTNEEETLRKLGADFYRTNRGGLITFHGPGQLVIYPILDLRKYQLNVRCYVRRLENTVIDMCKSFSIEAQTSPYTGVWVDDMKICALGIHISRHVTTHGLALNCNVDLDWFSHIIPCGIEGKKVTSLSQQLRRIITTDEAFPKFRDSFSRLFSAELLPVDEAEISGALQKPELCS